jgi:hypothetical protein
VASAGSDHDDDRDQRDVHDDRLCALAVRLAPVAALDDLSKCWR